MTEARITGRCGYLCHRCPAWEGNIRDEEERSRAAAGWERYWDIDAPVQTVRCRGCRLPRLEGYLYPERGCGIQRCAEERALDTCADCPDYPCFRLEGRIRVVEAVITDRSRRAGPADRERFLEPYDIRRNIEQLRQVRNK